MTPFTLAQWREYDDLRKLINVAKLNGETKIVRVGVNCCELLKKLGYDVSINPEGIVISWK